MENALSRLIDKYYVDADIDRLCSDNPEWLDIADALAEYVIGGPNMTWEQQVTMLSGLTRLIYLMGYRRGRTHVCPPVFVEVKE